MIQKKNDRGFSLENDTVCFEFHCNCIPKEENGLFVLTATGDIPVPQIRKKDRLILPIDDGIAIDVERQYVTGEADIDNIGAPFLSRNATMSMVLVERNRQFLLICLENGIDAAYHARRIDGMYRLELSCSTPHKVFYGIFPSLTEACNVYKKIKNIHPVTLSEKMQRLPEARKLLGGIFWIWNNHYDEIMYANKDTDISPLVGDDLLMIAEDLKKNGVNDAMFGLFFDGDSKYSKELYEKYGYICTQYDNYNDVLNPELLSVIPNNRIKNCGYTNRRLKDYPNGIMKEKNGKLAKAWALKGTDGEMHAQNTLCPKVAADRMREEIPQILKEYPYYKGRFIDVYGCRVSACYDENHPLSTEECLTIKQNAYKFLGDIGLIAGTEDGFEDIIDDLVYTEGLHSPGYFRTHESGRRHAHQYDDERAAHIKNQMLDPSCRVPLWHLVYHGCLLGFPYWGDSTESSNSIIKEKILYACLFGCPPLYSFFVKDYADRKHDILESQRKISAVLEKTAMLPMTDYEILGDDYTLQRCVFGDKYEVIANFSQKEVSYMGHLIKEKDYYFGEIQ